MTDITSAKRIVVKVGTSSLTYSNGKMNLRHIGNLCRVLSDLHNLGKEIVLVTSGAIGVGLGKLGLSKRPEETSKKQALAAIGQCELMFIYDKFFGEFNQSVAQVLLTPDVIHNSLTKNNAENTFFQLLSMGIIPIVNENDTVATDELEGSNFGDNDTLSAMVAALIEADLLIILTDIDGLFDMDPRIHKDAKLIPYVDEINDEIVALAGGSISGLGTGGMATKISAASISTASGIPCTIINGNDPENLYKIFDGETIGTTFR